MLGGRLVLPRLPSLDSTKILPLGPHPSDVQCDAVKIAMYKVQSLRETVMLICPTPYDIDTKHKKIAEYPYPGVIPSPGDPICAGQSGLATP
jgi:hypothetical protein